MTRKIIILKMIAVALVLSAIIPHALASERITVNREEIGENPQTVYITWQNPIPSSKKGDKLNMSVGVMVDGRVYASQEVFDILDIPKCPECPHCKGVAITVDGEAGTYYPLRENAEQYGYSVLWAPRNEEDGKAIDYWVYIAEEDLGTDWVRVVFGNNQEANYKTYIYYYAYKEGRYWYVDWGDETERIPNRKITVME